MSAMPHKSAAGSIRKVPILMIRRLLPTVLLAWLSLNQPGFADPVAGKSLAKKKCQICHGLNGVARIPIAPHLAGESQIYLQVQLKAFRSGKRRHEMMSIVAKDLSDDDITNLAAWYSAIKISVEMPK
jgi:cytochrome c553